mmetsp:Transcript_7040/g.25482  ORF Transcript_7040/g.25482 Transcript_7040/m.25482 type:complete len:240 (-) Transcript_7040:517-1236(-)
MITEYAKTYAASVLAKTFWGLQMQYLSAYLSMNRSIFWDSPGSLNPPRKCLRPSSNFISVKSNISTYAYITSRLNASASPRYSPMEVLSSWSWPCRKKEATSLAPSPKKPCFCKKATPFLGFLLNWVRPFWYLAFWAFLLSMSSAGSPSSFSPSPSCSSTSPAFSPPSLSSPASAASPWSWSEARDLTTPTRHCRAKNFRLNSMVEVNPLPSVGIPPWTTLTSPATSLSYKLLSFRSQS